MGIKFIKNWLEKIAEYLPDDEPATEAERLYEEGKERIYELHQSENTLFYVEEAWLEGTQGKIYGEVVKGIFRPGDRIRMLDVHGCPLLEAELFSFKEDPEEEKDVYREYKKGYLLFEREKLTDKEDFFVQSYYAAKKH